MQHRRALPPAALALALALAAPPALAQGSLPSIAEKTRGMERQDGFLPLYWDAAAGKVWLELPRLGEEMIYVVSLPAGVGSNDIGLDRGQLGGERIVRFERTGPRVLMVQPNYAFRAGSDNPDERRAVEEAFAQSVLWGFKVEAETEGRVLVDATDFALRDAHGVVPTLRRTRQGDFRLDASRSAPYLPRTRAFPRNTELEVTLTFTGDNPGAWLRDVAPTPEAVTVRQRHSFVALPEPGYVPRRSDPRAGYFGIEYRDFAVPISEPVTRRFIARHRLRRRDASGEPVEPIVYYLDRGAPEPIRTALLEGARWWNQAFEAAGYRNAFRVELLPEGADPMDVRYNVIQWVHRFTRGWSYGASVMDPRTGEIIKGHVTLGSLRVRQDYLIAEGLLSPYETGTETPPELAAMALARIRQLAAHEVGHTLGLAHNYVASAQGRASVMDYPHPVARLTADGRVDLSDAYREGIGEWDRVAITWGYADLPAGADERAALDRILAEARARGITFLTDQDARPTAGVHPQAHLWDNGTDAAAELRRVLRVRRAALARFGERAIRAGAPLATLEETLVPLYLHHRYQVEAAVKLVGGMRYTYALRGDGEEPLQPVPAADQRQALDALLATLEPDELALPVALLEKIPPRPYTYDAHRELFNRWTGLPFDAVSPAAAAADLTLGLLLDARRAAWLVEQEALAGGPGLNEVLSRTVAAVFRAREQDRYRDEIGRTVQRVLVERLMGLAADAEMPQVRALASLHLERVRDRARTTPAPRDAESAHLRLLAADITRFLERDWEPRERRAPPAAPPGAPIGDEGH
ncbi:MAG TPA: zinc-dependent metalloprotease [Longimicrobiaceae bacterium]|nr:zinc-dependent metalloprotease [Longimicrobiaceae bacterium]